MNAPISISYHPQSGFIARFGDRELPFSQLSPQEREAALREIVSRYNEHDALADFNSAALLLKEAVERDAVAFDSGDEVDGGDLVEWFGGWRIRAAGVL